jgi:hypothetical protein
VALKSCGNTNNNYQTIQHHLLDLNGKFVAERAKKKATAGVEDRGQIESIADNQPPSWRSDLGKGQG